MFVLWLSETCNHAKSPELSKNKSVEIYDISWLLVLDGYFYKESFFIF